MRNQWQKVGTMLPNNKSFMFIKWADGNVYLGEYLPEKKMFRLVNKPNVGYDYHDSRIIEYCSIGDFINQFNTLEDRLTYLENQQFNQQFEGSNREETSSNNQQYYPYSYNESLDRRGVDIDDRGRNNRGNDNENRGLNRENNSSQNSNQGSRGGNGGSNSNNSNSSNSGNNGGNSSNG